MSRTGPARHRVLVSAHRCNDRALIEAALALGCDFVEVDLVREGEGVTVAHDPGTAGTVTYEEVLALLAPGGRLHLDLKFSSPGHRLEQEVVDAAVAALGVDRLVVTTGRRSVLRHLRDRARADGVPLALGLSLGRGVAGRPWRERVAIRRGELFPAPALAAAGADVVVGHWSLALLTLRRFSRRHSVPLLVWTVDPPLLLRLFLRSRSTWMLTTNRPALALALRDRHDRAARPARLRA